MTLSSFSSFLVLARQGSISAKSDRRGAFVWISIACYQLVNEVDGGLYGPCIPAEPLGDLHSPLLPLGHLAFPSTLERHQLAKSRPLSDRLISAPGLTYLTTE
jgi:hypothetical protein